MKTHFGYVFFLATLAFGLFVIVAGSPLSRIERACLPVEWVGRAITSVVSLGGPEPEGRVRVASEEAVLSCQYLIFRQFYREALEEQRAAREAREAAAAEQEPPAAPEPAP